MNREQLAAWKAGHDAANARHRRTVASMTADEKLRQISRLMSSAGLFDLSRRSSGDRMVRDLWQRLRALASETDERTPRPPS